MKWGIANSKASMGGSGDAELNLAYGLTPPSDTTKIWVRTDKTPTSVEITTEPTWSDVIETSVIKSDLPSNTFCDIVRAGEYVYIIGGVINSESINKITRYNTITNQFEDVATLPYGVQETKSIVYKDYIYIFYGRTWITDTYYYQLRMIKFNWKTNTLYTDKYGVNKNTNQYDQSYFRGGFNVFRVGKQIFIAFGGTPYQPSYYPSNEYRLYARTSQGEGVPFYSYDVFDIGEDEFLQLGENALSKNPPSCVQQINKNCLFFGGYWGGYLGLSIYNILKGKDIKGEQIIEKQIPSTSPMALFGRYNVLLTTNDGLYVCGGRQNNISSSTANTSDKIYYWNYKTQTLTETSYTMPVALPLNSCQYNEQTSYGRSTTYMVKVENKILLEENKLIIIPDVYNDDEYTLGSTNGIDIKTSIQNVYIGNSNGKAEEVRIYKYDGSKWVGINCDDYIENKKNLFFGYQWLDTTSTSLTMGITCNVGDLIIASVVARDSGNESVSAGWTLLGRSQVGDLNQTLAFYKKIATSTFEEITITQSTIARIYISMVNFVGKADATMGTFTFTSNAIRGEITLPNKLCLVGASSNLWLTTVPYGFWHYQEAEHGYQVDDAIAFYKSPYFQQRLGNWVDDSGGARMITANISGGANNTIILGYVVIEDGNVLI